MVHMYQSFFSSHLFLDTWVIFRLWLLFEQCFNEHRGQITFLTSVLGTLWWYQEVELVSHTEAQFQVYWGKFILFSKTLDKFTFPPQWMKVPLSPQPYLHWLFVFFWCETVSLVLLFLLESIFYYILENKAYKDRVKMSFQQKCFSLLQYSSHLLSYFFPKLKIFEDYPDKIQGSSGWLS